MECWHGVHHARDLEPVLKTDLPVRCSCGRVQGLLRDVSPKTSNNVVCCCRHCQEYAKKLEKADEILDEYGGTNVFQVSPAQLSFSEGFEHVTSLQLTPKGAVRWYASCCNTPIANTLPDPNLPFLAFNPLSVPKGEMKGSLEQAIGPLRATVNGNIPAEEKAARKADVSALLAMLWHYAPLFFKAWWRGDAKHSPFVSRH